MLQACCDQVAISSSSLGAPHVQWQRRLWQRRQRRQQCARLRVLAAAQGPDGSDEGGDSRPIASAPTFLAAGTVGNAGMVAVGVALGDWAGLDVSGQWLHVAPNLPAAVACTLPLLAACYWSVANADRNTGFAEMRQLFKETMIPQLRVLPLWGLGLLSLGAGVGEETLFRAFLQAGTASGLADVAPQLPAAAATAVSLAGTSVVFGAAHALTPLYFLYASVAGALFGVEYLTYGVATAATTHFLYDWVALWFIVREWGGADDSSKGQRS